MVVYVVFIALQILLLGKKYKPIQLLQIPCTYLVGLFTTYTSTDYLLAWLPIPTAYIMKLVYLFVSIVFIGTGVALYLIPNLIPLPPEGLVNAIVESSKGKLEFSNTKVIFDSSLVVVSAILSLTFLGEPKTVREGTVLAALLVGKVVGFVSNKYKERFVAWIEKDEKYAHDEA